MVRAWSDAKTATGPEVSALSTVSAGVTTESVGARIAREPVGSSSLLFRLVLLKTGDRSSILCPSSFKQDMKAVIQEVR